MEKRKYFDLILNMAIIAWFLFQSINLALRIKIGLPPDELHHYYLSKFYQEAPGFSIEENDSTYRYGTLNTIPYLYHLISGKLLHLNFFSEEDELPLRFLSIIMAVGVLLAVKKIAAELTADRFIPLLAMGIMASIPMFVLISSSMSYDAATNLLGALLILYTVRFFKYYRLHDFLLVTLFLLIGGVTKITFLPFFVIYFLILISFAGTFIRRFREVFRSGLSNKERILLALVAFFLILNIRLYGGNFYHYKTYNPSLEQVIGEDKAYQLYAQAQRDRDYMQSASSRPISAFDLFLRDYLIHAAKTSLGFMGHKVIFPTGEDLRRLALFALPPVAGLLLITYRSARRLFRGKKLEFNDAFGVLAAIGFGYLAMTIADNYITYTKMRAFGFGLQGRYLFPVLPCFAALFAYLSLVWIPPKIRLPAAAIILYGFAANGWLIYDRLTPEWLM